MRSDGLSDSTAVYRDGGAEFLDNAPGGCVELDALGKVSSVNPRFCSWLNLTRQEVEGRSFLDFLTPGGRILFETSVEPLLNIHGQADALALDLRKPDGTRVPVLLSAKLERDADGHRGRTHLMMLQAAARRQYERDLIGARNEAQNDLLEERQLAELREQFVAVLGHDLRNPVASMVAASRLLKTEDFSERGAQILELMQGTTRRMSLLIDNILDFARGRLGGGINMTLGEVSVADVVNQVVDEARITAPDRQIITQISLDRSAKGDASRLGQLVSNLLGNALTHGSAQHPIVVGATMAGDDAMDLWVANHGDPIPPEALTRLFDPFVRGDTAGRSNGLGLGLHIASEIAKAHGGTLTVRSTTKETRFTFSMPIRADAV